MAKNFYQEAKQAVTLVIGLEKGFWPTKQEASLSFLLHKTVPAQLASGCFLLHTCSALEPHRTGASAWEKGVRWNRWQHRQW